MLNPLKMTLNKFVMVFIARPNGMVYIVQLWIDLCVCVFDNNNFVDNLCIYPF